MYTPSALLLVSLFFLLQLFLHEIDNILNKFNFTDNGNCKIDEKLDVFHQQPIPILKLDIDGFPPVTKNPAYQPMTSYRHFTEQKKNISCTSSKRIIRKISEKRTI